MRATLVGLLGFGLVSGVGLALDFALFLSLIAGGIKSGYANFLSASAAVTFVYFASTKQVFDYQGHFLFLLFLVYVIYQILAVAAASWAIEVLVSQWNMAPIIAKIAILPVTFSVNYFVMRFLTSK